MTKEKLEQILKSYPTIKKVKWIHLDQCGFSRNIEFFINEIRYRINWYCNMCTLYTNNNLIVLFTDLRITNTWPHPNSKMDIQFINNDDICAVLPIDFHKETSQ